MTTTEEPTAADPVPQSAIDLMAALKASLDRAKERRTQPGENPTVFAVTDPRCYPDLRCEDSIAQRGRDGQWVGYDCVLEDEHDDDHTDGALYWNDAGDFTFR